MNIIDITKFATRNKSVLSGLRPQLSNRRQADAQRVKIDVKKMLVLQNKLTTTNI